MSRSTQTARGSPPPGTTATLKVWDSVHGAARLELVGRWRRVGPFLRRRRFARRRGLDAWIGEVRVLDLSTDRVVSTVRVRAPDDTALSPDGRLLAVASHPLGQAEDGAVFDVRTGEEAFRLSCAHLLQRRDLPGGVLESRRPICRRGQRGRHPRVGCGNGKAPPHAARSNRIRPRPRLEPGLLSLDHGRFGRHREGVGDPGDRSPRAVVAAGSRDEQLDRGSGLLARWDPGNDRRRGKHRREDLGPRTNRRRRVDEPSRPRRIPGGVHAGRTAPDGEPTTPMTAR